ncbi:MAG: CHRD domain-containing protein [Comamonadaceae bacterium]
MAVDPTCLIIAVVIALTGCSTLQPDAHLAAFSTQMTGMNQLPPVATPASGQLFAVLNKNTRLFRWKLSFTGLRGSASAGHFHGPAVVGANATSVLAFKAPVKSPLEGQATLTSVQAADLMAGKWYADIHTASHPGGEIRGQLILRE